MAYIRRQINRNKGGGERVYLQVVHDYRRKGALIKKYLAEFGAESFESQLKARLYVATFNTVKEYFKSMNSLALDPEMVDYMTKVIEQEVVGKLDPEAVRWLKHHYFPNLEKRISVLNWDRDKAARQKSWADNRIKQSIRSRVN